MMRILIRGAIALVALVGVFVGGVWIASERILTTRYVTPAASIVASTDPSIIGEGARLANTYGCTGCHGATLNGELFGEIPFVHRTVAPNLPRLAARYTDEDFARSVRHGVKPDGRSVIGMPSGPFFDMTDEDLTAVVSRIRAQKDDGRDLPTSFLHIGGRAALVFGVYAPEASYIDHAAPRRAYDFSNVLQRGEYIARNACGECHGLDFKGQGVNHGDAPDLVVASAYSPEEFHALMRKGEATGGRNIDFMGRVARWRFVHFADDEIDAIHAFLIDRAMRPAE